MPYEFTRWNIVPERWTLLDYLAIIAAMPIGRAGYELQNLAFLDAMVKQYGPEVGRQIFDDVVPLTILTRPLPFRPVRIWSRRSPCRNPGAPARPPPRYRA